MALTDEERQTLTTLAEKLSEEDGITLPNLVPVSTLKGRLADKDRARESALAEANARLSELQKAIEERDTRLREIEDSGKTQAEKVAEERVRERQSREAAMKALQTEKDRAAQLDREFSEERLTNTLKGLLHGAHNLEHAVAALRVDFPGIGYQKDETGKPRMTLEVDGLPVDDPAEAIKQWRLKNPHLLAKTGTELPLSGRGARVEPPAKDPTEGMTEAQAMAYLTRRYATN